ncbi:MAG: P1 family peptidase, partial [Parvularculaceae bacterium]
MTGTEKCGAPGPQNTITDVDGLKVGQASDAQAKTGVTVILPDAPAVCSVDVRGGGPGTRETDLLAPETLVDHVNALVLAGGSVYGLGAADGVAAVLGAAGTGFSLIDLPGVPVAPIVPAAILFDLANGGDKEWGYTPPYSQLGKQALKNAGRKVDLGAAGAGTGARAGAYAGGLGSASFITEDGIQIGAIAAVNSFGSPYLPGSKAFWACPFEIEDEFGGRDWPAKARAQDFPPDTKLGAPTGANTTICIVATNVSLSKADAKRLAIMAQDGLARAIRPAHGPTDGDVVFALSTGRLDMQK